MNSKKPLCRRVVLAAGAVTVTALSSVVFAAPADAATSITFAGGVLTVNGDAARNSLVVGTTSSGLVTLNGSPVLGGSVPRSALTLIRMNGGDGDDFLGLDESHGTLPSAELDGGAGNDRLDGGSGSDKLVGGLGIDSISGNSGPDTIFGGPGNDKVLGGPGDDRVSLGADADRFTWNHGDGDDHVDGDDGTDTLTFNGSPDEDRDRIFAVGARAHVIAFAEIGGAGPVNTDAGGIERLDVVNMSGPQRQVFVDDLTGTGVQVVHLLHVAGPAPAEDFVSGTLGDDRIRIRGTATGVSIGQLAASVAIDGAARLTVRGGDGNDVIDATGLAAGVVTLTEKGGEFPVASPRSAFDGNDTLVGTPGDDFLFGGTGVNSYDGRGGNDTIIDQ